MGNIVGANATSRVQRRFVSPSEGRAVAYEASPPHPAASQPPSPQRGEEQGASVGASSPCWGEVARAKRRAGEGENPATGDRPSLEGGAKRRKILRIRLTATLLAALALCACRESGKAGDYFAVSGRLFEFNYRMAVATYVVTLDPLKPMQEGQMAVASFENPAGGAPIVVRQKIWPKLPHVTLESPPLACVVKNRPYAVAIRIEDVGGGVLQTLDTTVTSSLDESILPDRPLVIGPEYELNPDLKGHPNGKLPGEPRPKCPART